MFSFLQLRRSQTGWIALLAFAFFLWRVSVSLHWWAVAAFFGTAMLAGALNAVLLRRWGRGSALRLAAAMRTLAVVSGAVVLALLAATR